MRLLPLLLLACLFVTGCTDADIARLDAIAVSAEEKAQASEHWVLQAKEAVAQAKKLSELLDVERAKPVMDKAEQALAVAMDGQALAKASADAARKTADAAKAAQLAGGSSVDVVVAGIVGLITGGVSLLPLVGKLITTAKAFRQTVVGIDAARKSMGEAEFQAKLAVPLGIAQDEGTKAMVDSHQS